MPKNMTGDDAKKAATTAGTWISRAILGDLRERILVIEKNVESIKEKTDSLETKMEKLSNAEMQTTMAVSEIQTLLGAAGIHLTRAGLIGPGSPLQLTDKGKELAKAADIYNFVSNNRITLIAEIKAKDPHTNYDVQEYAKKVLEEHKENPILTVLKNYAYKNGSPLEPLLDVAGIILRDEALKELKFDE